MDPYRDGKKSRYVAAQRQLIMAGLDWTPYLPVSYHHQQVVHVISLIYDPIRQSSSHQLLLSLSSSQIASAHAQRTQALYSSCHSGRPSDPP